MKSAPAGSTATTSTARPSRKSEPEVGFGTAVMEELHFPGMPSHDMVSVYAPAGEALMLTHYCAENNQPRMKALRYDGSPREAGVMKFEFVDVTNLASPDGGRVGSRGSG